MPPSSPFDLSPPSSPREKSHCVLTSGSRAAPIPEKATRGFATVSSLVRSEHFAQQLDDDFAEIQQALSRRESLEGTEEGAAAAKKPKKRATKTVTTIEGEKPKPKPKGQNQKADKELDNNNTILDPELRLPRTTRSPFFENAGDQTTTGTTTEPTANAPKLTKSGRPRKPRAKKEKPENGNTEPKPKRTRVTKPKAAAKAGKAEPEAADVVSAHFPVDKYQVNNTTEVRVQVEADGRDASMWEVPQTPRSRQKAPKQRPTDPLAGGLDLEEAVSRRRDWTPPRDTTAQSPSTISTGKENRPLTRGAMTGNFTHLISNFTYESPTPKVTNNTATPAEATKGITKRRRVELVELPGVQTTSRESSPVKGKAPKKKPRTITDLVTGQYAPRDASLDAQAITSDLFSPRTSTMKVPLNDVAATDGDAPQKKPVRKRSKSRDSSEGTTAKAKPRARKAAKKPPPKPKSVAEKLLSPTSALHRMNRQEVLFGTSSQLALEESPTTVRQIQRAITESEQDIGETSLLRASPRWPNLQRIEGKRGLWRESTRDSEGGLLEDTENIYIPEPDRTQDLPLLTDVAPDEPKLSSEFVDIEDIEPAAPIAISSDLPTPPRSQVQAFTVQSEPRKQVLDDVFDDIDNFDCGLPPSNQNAESQNSFADIDDFQSASSADARQSPPDMPMPPASAPVTATVTATGSPKKRRGRPPKAKDAIPTVTASAPPPQRRQSPSQQVSQRLPSTPPKGSGRFIDIEEILDSEDEALEAFSPTPPRVRKLQDSPPLPLAFGRHPSAPATLEVDDVGITPIFRILTAHLEWANIKPSICAFITAHIRSIPPTTDPKKPSWHEKILMYDPIILEDFTAYLNSNTKLRTYKRATQKQIKAYNNELKMKGNAILGLERDDQVLATEKELEVHMVRDWCQEMSICCIHAKESRGRGSARKGFY